MNQRCLKRLSLFHFPLRPSLHCQFNGAEIEGTPKSFPFLFGLVISFYPSTFGLGVVHCNSNKNADTGKSCNTYKSLTYEEILKLYKITELVCLVGFLTPSSTARLKILCAVTLRDRAGRP